MDQSINQSPKKAIDQTDQLINLPTNPSFDQSTNQWANQSTKLLSSGQDDEATGGQGCDRYEGRSEQRFLFSQGAAAQPCAGPRQSRAGDHHRRAESFRAGAYLSFASMVLDSVGFDPSGRLDSLNECDSILS